MNAQPADVETGSAQPDVLSLEVPPDASSIRTARLFASAVARHYGCDESVVEDVKLAISEACTRAVKAHRDGGIEAPIAISAHGVGAAVRFEIVDAGSAASMPSAELTPASGMLEGALGLSVIQSLFEQIEVAPGPTGGTVVGFSVPVGPDQDFEP